LDAPTPRASLYVWTPAPTGWECAEFASAGLEQAGVSFTPGTVFGPGGQGYVRVSITAPLERIEEAMRRMQRWLGGA
jgi:LL-diaminopimelate aminotransferase